jgi:hypothetical protein
VPLLTYRRVELEEPPVLIHRSPFVPECVGASEVTQILMPVENIVIGAPAATAPAVAGTAVPDFRVLPPVALKVPAETAVEVKFVIVAVVTVAISLLAPRTKALLAAAVPAVTDKNPRLELVRSVPALPGAVAPTLIVLTIRLFPPMSTLVDIVLFSCRNGGAVRPHHYSLKRLN